MLMVAVTQRSHMNLGRLFLLTLSIMDLHSTQSSAPNHGWHASTRLCNHKALNQPSAIPIAARSVTKAHRVNRPKQPTYKKPQSQSLNCIRPHRPQTCSGSFGLIPLVADWRITHIVLTQEESSRFQHFCPENQPTFSHWNHLKLSSENGS